MPNQVARERLHTAGFNDFEAEREHRHEFDSEADEAAYHSGWMNAFDYGDRMRGSVSRDARSDLVPSWFDPADAGESWDGDY